MCQLRYDPYKCSYIPKFFDKRASSEVYGSACEKGVVHIT